MNRSAAFPVRWDPFFKSKMTLADVYHYPAALRLPPTTADTRRTVTRVSLACSRSDLPIGADLGQRSDAPGCASGSAPERAIGATPRHSIASLVAVLFSCGYSIRDRPRHTRTHRHGTRRPDPAQHPRALARRTRVPGGARRRSGNDEGEPLEPLGVLARLRFGRRYGRGSQRAIRPRR
jgi:hypothetical protein